MPRYEPGMPGCEAQKLPLCHAAAPLQSVKLVLEKLNLKLSGEGEEEATILPPSLICRAKMFVGSGARSPGSRLK